MNADPADTHLDLEDLIAAAADQGAPEHLARCEQCQRELNRWNLVACGVRALAAGAPQAARPARPRRTGRRAPARYWRRAMLVAGSAAAALVLLVGLGTAAGLVHVHFSGPGRGTGTVLTTVLGCSQLEQAGGVLEQVNGSSLIIKTASGQPVTVTTTATTFVSMTGNLLTGNLLRDITDGASVRVRGSQSDGTIRATFVTVGQPFRAVNPPGMTPVQGTVADASTAGFTLVTSSGTRIPVTTSSDTLVVVVHARLGQLQVGAAVIALVQAGPDGTLPARAVAMISQLPSGAQVHVSVKDCSSSSIQEALAMVSALPVSAGA
jgi:hypothetical protein